MYGLAPAAPAETLLPSFATAATAPRALISRSTQMANARYVGLHATAIVEAYTPRCLIDDLNG